MTTPGPSQPCGGDSGGAAFVTRDGQEVLVGVVSHGDARCERRAHFTRVDGEARAFLEGFADRDNAGVDPLPHEGEQGCSSSGGRPSLLGSLIAVLLLLRRRQRSTAIEPLRRGSKGARMSSIDGI